MAKWKRRYVKPGYVGLNVRWRKDPLEGSPEQGKFREHGRAHRALLGAGGRRRGLRFMGASEGAGVYFANRGAGEGRHAGRGGVESNLADVDDSGGRCMQHADGFRSPAGRVVSRDGLTVTGALFFAKSAGSAWGA
jgi:hypothetical protein